MASGRRIKIPDFNAELQDILSKYGDDITQAMPKVVKTAAEVAKKETQAGANVKTGAYRRGWAVREEGSYISSKAIVHNRTRYQLAHLLEKGHALHIRGEDYGSTRAFPHIAPAEKHAIEYVEKAVKEAIENA